MGRCQICGQQGRTVAKILKVCGQCLRERWSQAQALAVPAHAVSRRDFQLPPVPPQVAEGRRCGICAQDCRVEAGGIGYCGLPVPRPAASARVSWYDDPLPTNCVAEFVCPARTGCGYPRFAHRRGPEFGFYNLAVYYEACSLNCLFCQNWRHRYGPREGQLATAEAVADAVGPDTACICFFGGDPAPQWPHSLRAASLALERHRGRVLRVCWETNGLVAAGLLDQAVELALRSGGCLKFDLKAWHEPMQRALTGASLAMAFENFERVAKRLRERPQVPLLVASTLLVPGYVDAEEVRPLAHFIANLSSDIPYSLLAFHPEFLMQDLPATSAAHAQRCVVAARQAGLKNVHVGNQRLLWKGDY
jgi:pyruvate formate lyase activating enzyme